MEHKKLLADDNITALYQTNMSPKHYIKRYKQHNELRRVWMESRQRLNCTCFMFWVSNCTCPQVDFFEDFLTNAPPKTDF